MANRKQKWISLVCCDCKTRNKNENVFRELIKLTDSGLTVYVKATLKPELNMKESVIFRNVGNKILKKADFFGELCRRKTKCYLCNVLIQKVCNLINDVIEIKEKEMIAICEHCKRSTGANNCKKCEDTIKKFLNNQINQYQYRQQALKTRLYEVRRILSLIVDKKKICNHKQCQAYYDSNAELKILLELIKSPLPTKEPDIQECFSLMETNKDSVRGNISSDLLLKRSGLFFKSKKSSDILTSDSSSESFCICKYLRSRNVESTQLFTLPSSTLKSSLNVQGPIPKVVSPSKILPQETRTSVLKDLNAITSAEKVPLHSKKEKKIEESKPYRKTSNEKKKIETEDDKENITVNKRKEEKITEGNKKESTTPEIKPRHKKSNEKKEAETKDKENINNQKTEKMTEGTAKIGKKDKRRNISMNGKEDKKSTEEKKKKPNQDPEYKMMMELIKASKKDKRSENTANKGTMPVMPRIDSLPEIKHVEREVKSESSGSIIECGHGKLSNIPEVIHGNRIVPFHELHKLHSHAQQPLIYKVRHEFVCAENTLPEAVITDTERTASLKSKSQPSVDTSHPGIIKYELSNKLYIEKGWTQLPSIKIVRRMNVYKMVPAYPQFDWFANHKNKVLFYSTGEQLAEVDEYGSGKWFYKNGRVALEHSKSKGVNVGLKYVVYDSDEITEGRKIKSNKILALFDHLGNGIVYDKFGNARLKYNQSEGLVIDKKLGPPGRWKWHTLNDPPDLQHVYMDTIQEPDKCFKDVIKEDTSELNQTQRGDSDEMIEIEFENFVKEKASKMLQNYKPFEIRMKVVKVNEYFSVRIMNQANIQLLFRYNKVSLKINMGLLLRSKEIVDSNVTDVADVVTPFDRPISRSKSVNSI